jgi:hydroxysqualene dehydroxylase
VTGGTVHIIGAGLAGLGAAVALTGAGRRVIVHEGAGQPGGRCRSYHDPQLGQTIDNGNHLVLSGNQAVARYLNATGALAALTGPAEAQFDFADLRTGDRWVIHANDGRVPWWIFKNDRRVPGTVAADYLKAGALLRGKRGDCIPDRVDTSGRAWSHLLDPVLLAALNTPVATGSADLAAAVIRQSLGRGGAASCPRIAHPTLAAAFIDPALALLAAQGNPVRLNARLRMIAFDQGRVTRLGFGDDTIPIGADDHVILAVPPWSAADLVPELTTPTEFCAIVNAHFALPPPSGTPAMTGLIGGTAEWLFAFPDRLSITVSAADRLLATDRAELAQIFWAEICAVLRLDRPMPAWQVVKERRATFAATPAQNARRPSPRTRWRNLTLAGDWTQTGLPATIEGALQSGEAAARLIVKGP